MLHPGGQQNADGLVESVDPRRLDVNCRNAERAFKFKVLQIHMIHILEDVQSLPAAHLSHPMPPLCSTDLLES